MPREEVQRRRGDARDVRGSVSSRESPFDHFRFLTDAPLDESGTTRRSSRDGLGAQNTDRSAMHATVSDQSLCHGHPHNTTEESLESLSFRLDQGSPVRLR